VSSENLWSGYLLEKTKSELAKNMSLRFDRKGVSPTTANHPANTTCFIFASRAANVYSSIRIDAVYFDGPITGWDMHVCAAIRNT